MTKLKPKPTIKQLKTIKDGIILLDDYPLVVCEGCMVRNGKKECHLSAEEARLCFDDIIWQTSFLKRNIIALVDREISNQTTKGKKK